MIAVIAVAFVAALVGFLTRRWIVSAAAVAVWPVYFFGVLGGWWGSGVGDGWQIGLIAATVLAAVAGAAGVLVRRFADAPEIGRHDHRREGR